MTARLVIGLAGLLVLPLVALGLPAASADTCTTLSDGTQACGSATADMLTSTAACTGAATASVSWSCAVDTSYPTCHAETDRTGATFEGIARCGPSACTRATLYANGVVVAQSPYEC
jgi:hypothetical protein